MEEDWNWRSKKMQDAFFRERGNQRGRIRMGRKQKRKREELSCENGVQKSSCGTQRR